MAGPDDPYFRALLADDAAKLYDLAPCGYLTTAADGTICKANQTFLTMVGYTLPEVVGKLRFPQLLTAGGRIYHETHYAPMLHMSGAAREIALDLRHRDGHVIPVLVNAIADRDPDDAVAAVRVAVFDATHRREYERELLRAKERAEASEAQARALARTLQQTLIPPTPPAVPQLDVAAEYRPAGDGAEVGGDFYDVFQVGSGDWVVVIGDVCGKGAEAAVVTALARDVLRAASMITATPAATLRRLNDVLLNYAGGRFCTVAMVRLRRENDGWQGIVSAGGHPLPIRRTPDGRVDYVGRPGTILGVVSEPQLHDVQLQLGEGDELVLYTDGLTEGRRGTEFYGEERAAGIVAQDHACAADTAAALLADVVAFQNGRTRDDIAIVVLRASE
jgi:phosphoserine phosphatase RsbU/P